MNNKYIFFVSRRLATSSYRSVINFDVLALRCIVFLLMACASLYCANANSGQVCLPQGLGEFPSMPTTFNLKPINNGGDKLLYEEDVRASATSTCSIQSSAALEFQILNPGLFTRNPAYAKVDTGDPSKLKLSFTATTPYDTLSPSNYALRYILYIAINCEGANIAATINDGIFRVTGLLECRSYIIAYRLQIYQNDAILSSAYSQATEDLGFRMSITLLNNNIPQAAGPLTIVPSSRNLKFTTGLYCSYSLSNSTIAFGTVADYELGSIAPKSYSINTSSCIGISGKNLNIYWRFANPHPTDDSMMLNEAPGGASGVVAQTKCSGLAARHNQSIRAATNVLATGLTINCTASLVRAPEVSNLSGIRAGTFRSTATLIFQFL